MSQYLDLLAMFGACTLHLLVSLLEHRKGIDKQSQHQEVAHGHKSQHLWLHMQRELSER
jgi:hypothetical protein